MFLDLILKFYPADKFNIYVNASEDAEIPKNIKNKINIIDTNFLKDFNQKIKILYKIDSVVYFGGDLFMELKGARFFRIVFYKMLIVNLFSKVLGKKIYYIGVGVGNISGYSLLLAKISGKLSNYIIFRDKESAKKLQLNKNKFSVFPDLAVSYFDKEKFDIKDSKNIKTKIGISLLYFVPNKENFQDLIITISGIVNKHTELDFVFLPLLISKNEKFDDIWVGDKLISQCKYENIEILKYSGINDYIKKIQGLDIIISARLHGNIFSVLSGISTIALSYSPKVTNFFIENNLKEFCLNINDLSGLDYIFSDILLDNKKVKFKMASKNLLKYNTSYKEKIDELFINNKKKYDV
ncbi:polysaccharide pyruvyl transferase family protein [Candidatus Gracilibacteria bacterium]|nr:polysaccharide pyruvyl transferase family protein [Candidatus Gracilibacteria bacterium]